MDKIQLFESKQIRSHWEGNKTVTNCHQLKMKLTYIITKNAKDSLENK